MWLCLDISRVMKTTDPHTTLPFVRPSCPPGLPTPSPVPTPRPTHYPVRSECLGVSFPPHSSRPHPPGRSGSLRVSEPDSRPPPGRFSHSDRTSLPLSSPVRTVDRRRKPGKVRDTETKSQFPPQWPQPSPPPTPTPAPRLGSPYKIECKFSE